MSGRIDTRPVSGRIDAVCVVHAEPPALRNERTAIDKRPVNGPVRIAALGPEGDHVVDTVHHGGLDQAVYAYSADEAQRWAEELGREVAPGSFGENLRISGIAVTDAVVGEHWSIGDTVLAVTAPRIPCAKFGEWLGEPHWVKRFTQRGDIGAYLRVLQEGTIAAGDAVEVVHVPAHGVTVRELFRGEDPNRLGALLDEPALSADARKRVEKWVARAGQH